MRAAILSPTLAALALLTVACRSTTNEQPASFPNVVIVMTDDQGWGDIGAHGNAVLDTPRLDELAAQSGGMDRFYVSPVCTPTRAALMTGRNSIRTRAIDTYRGRAMMDTREITIAEVLQDNGYATGLFGKWHLGDSYPMRPQDQGFEEVLCHRGGGLAQPADHLDNNRRYTNAWLYHNGVAAQTEGYCMDVYTDYAVEHMRESVAQGRPFFTYLATNTPHGPWNDVPADLLAKYKSRDLSEVLPDPRQAAQMAASFAMIENIDQNVGRLMDVLDELGVAEDTIFIYMHDNGPAIRHYVGEMRGMKSEVWEGGIRSPFFVRWPGKIPAGKRCAEIASHVDVWPTLVEATGVRAPKVEGLDGKSVWPLLNETATDWPPRLIHIQAHRGDVRLPEHNFATIGPRYKLVRASGFGRERLPEDPVPIALYDLQEDPLEENDLIEQMPELAESMLAEYLQWFADASAYEGVGMPPSIVIDFEIEPMHELNRNDWRPNTEGYGATGAYWIDCTKATLVDLTPRSRGKANGNVVIKVRIDDQLVAESKFNAANRRIDDLIPGIHIPPGQHRLGIEIQVDGKSFAADHLRISPPGTPR
ncbi:MAG: arylsulfatase [Planctomycetes bacterium]|nr:arylsulfatase [Planctomycetota bacterium]